MNNFHQQETRQVLPRFITIATAVRLTTLSRSTLHRLRSTGRLKTIKVGSRVLIDASFIEDLRSSASKSTEAHVSKRISDETL